MGRIYSVSFGSDVKNTGQDLLGVYAGSIALRIREVGVASYNASDETDLDFQMWRRSGTVTPGSGGVVVTPTPASTTDPAASFTAHAKDSTQSSSTIQENWIYYALDVAEGLIYSPAKELCMIIQPGEMFLLASGGTVTPNLNGYCLVEELS